MKRVFLELGGKSALVVLDDADFDLVAMFAAFTICSHAGQGCAITSRLLVPRAHHDAIVDVLRYLDDGRRPAGYARRRPSASAP